MMRHGDDFPRTVLWRRLDIEGLDACRLDRSGDGYEIAGTAIFMQRDGPARLDYTLVCDGDWTSRVARVDGWLGIERKSLTLECSRQGGWTVNGTEIDAVHGLLDVDLGFTPATNTNAIRRLRLQPGEETETKAVWLDMADWQVKPLTQNYRRLSPTAYAYRSPLHFYAADLVTDEFGLIRSYPQLWEAVPFVSSN